MVDSIHYPSKHSAIQGLGQSIPTIIGLDDGTVAKNLFTCVWCGCVWYVCVIQVCSVYVCSMCVVCEIRV